MSHLATKEPGCGLTWGECACVPGSYRRIGAPEVLGHLVMTPEPELSNVNPFIREIKPVNPKGYQSWIFIGRTDVEAETNTLATWCEELTHWKRPWCWERLKGMTEDEMVRWHHWLHGHEFEYAPGVGDGQGGLACFSPWGCKESEMTETELTGIQKFEFKLYDLSTSHLALENILFWE